MKQEITIEKIGIFSVTSSGGRNYLYAGDKMIATCIYGDYAERFGGITGWLTRIKKRSDTRMEKARSQIIDLEDEIHELHALVSSIDTAISG